MEKILYPFLPEGKNIEYVDGGNPWMMEARKACLELSTELNFPTGSVVVKEGKIIGRAGNQAKIRIKSFINFHKDRLCIRKLFKVKSGEKYWLCPGCASPYAHSERGAVRDAKTKGFDTKGADLYLWGHWWCCEPCWNAMIEGGINHVYLLKESEKLFNATNPQNILHDKFA